VPAVLGWAAPVFDTEATLFAAYLYGRLTAGEDLSHAIAYARLDLDQSEQLGQPGPRGHRSRNWHLARLYLNPNGGGALATADGPRKFVGRGRAVKAFLDTKSQQIPVASESQFVGRRREIQRILREFRASANERHAGVLIHGMGRQGKSSLAARVAHRLEHTHDLIVVFGRYDARAILSAFLDKLGTPAVAAIVNRHLPYLEDNPQGLLTALTELLEGPCEQQRKDAAGRIECRPVLLVVDDFEQALEEHASGRHSLKKEFVEAMRAVIRAFNEASTDSRLLFTSRFEFTLPDGATELSERLLSVPLHGMDPHEARKQAGARFQFESTETRRRNKNLLALQKAADRITAAALGNPGLQDLLFSICLEDPAACERCLSEMEQFQHGNKLPSEDKIRQFFENLTIHSLLALLSTGQKELLRAATLFTLPVPVSIFELLAKRVGQPAKEGVARLIGLGLCETYQDLYRPGDQALAINMLARTYAGTLTEAERKQLAGVVTGELFEYWGGASGNRERNYLQNYELTQLALLAQEPRTSAATGTNALRGLKQGFAYREAASIGKRIVSLLDSRNVTASVDLLRTAAEACIQIGEVREGGILLQRALAEINRLGKDGIDAEDHAATLLAYARDLVNHGQPDEAIPFLEQAKSLFPSGREQAIVLGEIAGILANKDEVDAALQLQQERLSIFEELGDKRSRAVTLGDIAQIRKDKGDVDAALQLHQEALAVYEGLGDKRSRAVALGDIAQIRKDKGEVDAALQSHRQALSIFEGLGDTRSRAMTLGDIARIIVDKGEVDAALELHQEALAVYEELGDTRSRAVTLSDIAQIRKGKGEVDAALELHQEELAVYEALGDKRSRAITLGDIARLRRGKGEVAAAIKLHQEALAVYEGLGDKRSRAVTLGDIAHYGGQRRSGRGATVAPGEAGRLSGARGPSGPCQYPVVHCQNRVGTAGISRSCPAPV
jgi:tetratricopeptide (TPR) repeat protein